MRQPKNDQMTEKIKSLMIKNNHMTKNALGHLSTYYNNILLVIL